LRLGDSPRLADLAKAKDNRCHGTKGTPQPYLVQLYG
jgi:hypothetical protein